MVVLDVAWEPEEGLGRGAHQTQGHGPVLEQLRRGVLHRPRVVPHAQLRVGERQRAQGGGLHAGRWAASGQKSRTPIFYLDNVGVGFQVRREVVEEFSVNADKPVNFLSLYRKPEPVPRQPHGVWVPERSGDLRHGLGRAILGMGFEANECSADGAD